MLLPGRSPSGERGGNRGYPALVLPQLAGLFLKTSQLIGIAVQTSVLSSHGRIIRIREVIAMTGLSRSSIYAAIKQCTFPAQLKLSTRSSG
ncbi:hypothetical protein DIR46_03380 [Massilia oculi]|uniref:AlpA family phage regulatory protein n=2 Tax=Massilia oculi TaxID=945844 RepID=A0A2S2DE00_9BURK|nr:hypothetical protein DIR46_03380 [Massilia oculi]